VGVSLLEVLRRAVIPPTAVLGRVAGRTTWRSTDDHEGSRTMPGLLVYRFDAPLFFANAAVLREEVVRLVDQSEPPAREVVLDAEGVIEMDITGAEALDELLDELDQRGARLILARVRTSLRTTLQQTGLEERLGSDSFHLHIHDAVADFARRTRTEQPPAHAQPQPAAPEPEPATQRVQETAHPQRVRPSPSRAEMTQIAASRQHGRPRGLLRGARVLQNPAIGRPGCLCSVCHPDEFLMTRAVATAP
jgi:anti-anti-sigma regulatory factor